MGGDGTGHSFCKYYSLSVDWIGLNWCCGCTLYRLGLVFSLFSYLLGCIEKQVHGEAAFAFGVELEMFTLTSDSNDLSHI